MSIGFLVPNQDSAIIWRGPKKNGLIEQFFTTVDWGELDYLVVDTPPGKKNIILIHAHSLGCIYIYLKMDMYSL